jgi:SpoVK/Ycf46/Vps4 family AAA+-type ATPase
LEDIDTVASAWSRNAKKEGEKTEKLTLGGLLNAIDGVAESDGRVLVITTNMRDKLDPALLRPGRVDLQLELGPMSPQMFRTAFKSFFPETIIPPSFEWPEGMTPAAFQHIILLHNTSPQLALKCLERQRCLEQPPVPQRDYLVQDVSFLPPEGFESRRVGGETGQARARCLRGESLLRAGP